MCCKGLELRDQTQDEDTGGFEGRLFDAGVVLEQVAPVSEVRAS